MDLRKLKKENEFFHRLSNPKKCICHRITKATVTKTQAVVFYVTFCVISDRCIRPVLQTRFAKVLDNELIGVPLVVARYVV